MGCTNTFVRAAPNQIDPGDSNVSVDKECNYAINIISRELKRD